MKAAKMIAGLLNKLTGRDLFGRGEKKGASRKDTLIFETDTPHQETHASYRLDRPLKGSFRFPVDGLDKIKFFTVKHGANTEGMRLIIKDGQDSSVLRKVALKGKKVKNNDYSTFRFKAIKDSADREFEFLLEGLGEPYPCVMHNSEVSFPGINLVPSGSVNLRIYAKTEMLGGYQSWIKMKEPSKRELEEQRRARFAYEPKISVIAPAFNAPQGVDAGAHGQFLADMVESVLKQTYSNWELVIAARGDGDLKDMLVDYSKKDSRVKVKFPDEDKGIAGNSNEALLLASGDFAALLDHRDTLAPFALFEVVKAVNENPLADFIYSDEDKISGDGKERFEPFFKPDFSPDTLRSYNYIGRFPVIKRRLLDEVGYFNAGYEGSEDYELILRATEKAQGIARIPKILYHRRQEERFGGNIAAESAKKAIAAHLKRIGMDAETADGPAPG
ncbi:MAG TPA: glycosyltransferase, partial [Thermodesulfobacteriota bacterium]|nr:glycosyltransferase [Thermodesulfobacteriota bacterium]